MAKLGSVHDQQQVSTPARACSRPRPRTTPRRTSMVAQKAGVSWLTAPANRQHSPPPPAPMWARPRRCPRIRTERWRGAHGESIVHLTRCKTTWPPRSLARALPRCAMSWALRGRSPCMAHVWCLDGSRSGADRRLTRAACKNPPAPVPAPVPVPVWPGAAVDGAVPRAATRRRRRARTVCVRPSAASPGWSRRFGLGRGAGTRASRMAVRGQGGQRRASARQSRTERAGAHRARRRAQDSQASNGKPRPDDPLRSRASTDSDTTITRRRRDFSPRAMPARCPARRQARHPGTQLSGPSHRGSHVP